MKFNVEKPGVKEFAIVGGGTLALILAWRWWSKRQASQQASSQQTLADSTSAPQEYEGTTPTGLSLGSLLLWIQDHASSTTTTRTTTRPAPRPRPRPRPKPKPRPRPKAA